MTEYEYLNHIQELGKKNKVFQIIYWFRLSTLQLFRLLFKEIFLKIQVGTQLIHHTKQKLLKVV